MHEVIAWIAATPVSRLLQDWSIWLSPLLEIVHFIGLTLVIGCAGVVDLRLLGFMRGVPVAVAMQLVPWAIAGFVMNLVSGLSSLGSGRGGVAFFAHLGGFVAAGGTNPLQMWLLLFKGAFGDWFSWQNTLQRAAPLMLTALCVALPARAGPGHRSQAWSRCCSPKPIPCRSSTACGGRA